MAEFREYSNKYGFRHRSETPDIAIELSLQPWRAFKPDGVIMFSDILTPLPALGIEFDVIKVGNNATTPLESHRRCPRDCLLPGSCRPLSTLYTQSCPVLWKGAWKEALAICKPLVRP